MMDLIRNFLWDKRDWLERARQHRWLQLPLVLGIGGALVLDRYLLCKDYLFRYTDEDQLVMWYAAHELLNGRLHEPCFFGQDYSSCLEGYLAAPLVGMHVPYHVALPLVAVMLGLLPFLLLALVAWKRGQSVVAGAALLVPLVMPVRYGIITGMARGFVPGVALAAIPMILLLPGAGDRGKGKRGWFGEAAKGWGRRVLQWVGVRKREGQVGGAGLPAAGRRLYGWGRTMPALRYFVAAVMAVVALQINPNCSVLLAPVAVYALLTSWREWKFWVFSAGGLIAAAAYPLYVYQFYHVSHPDYVAYLRGVKFGWSYQFFESFLHTMIAPAGVASPVLSDLVPVGVSGTAAAGFMAAAFAAVTVLLLVRRRAAGVMAAIAGAAFLFVTFAYERVRTTNGGNSASFPYCRMYLALPVVWVWLAFLAGSTTGRREGERETDKADVASRKGEREGEGVGVGIRVRERERVRVRSWGWWVGVVGRWGTRGALVGMVGVAVWALNVKRGQMDPVADATGIARESVLYPELRNAQVCAPIAVDRVYALGREVKKVAEERKADLLIVGNNGEGIQGKWKVYAMPAVTGVETLYLDTLRYFERRTWRVVEESQIKRNNVLLVDVAGLGMVVGGNRTEVVDGLGNVVEGGTGGGGEGETGRGGATLGGGGVGAGGGFAGGGGRGGMGGGRGGARGGRGAGGGRGGFGRGRLLAGDPTQQDVPHVVEIPAISLVNLAGQTVYESATFGGDMPRLYTARGANGKEEVRVTRQNWGGR